MILKHVHLVNFKKYKKATISLTESMVGIFGNNGAGKSSLFEAVTWCLYGVAQSMEGKEGVKQQDLIKDGEDEMGVEVEFTLGNHVYRVARYLSAKRGIKSRLRIDGEIQAVKSREVISRIEQDLGLNVKGFISSSFIRQKELDLITSAIASERKRLINRLFNLRVYEKFEEAAKNKKKEKENELKAVEIQIEGKEKELEQLPGMEKALKELKGTVETLKRQYEAVKTESEALKTQYNTLEEKYEEYQGLQSTLKVMEADIHNTENTLTNKKDDFEKIKEAESKKESLTPDYKMFLDLKEEFSSLDKKKKQYDTKTTELQGIKTEITITQKNLESRIKEFEEEIENLKKEELNLEESKTILKTVREKIQNLEDVPQQKEEEIQKIDKIKEKEAEILAEKAKYESRVSDLEEELKEIQSIGIGAPCPKCKRPLKKEHLDELMIKYNSEIAAHEKAREKYDSKQKHLAEMRKELDSKVKELKTKEKDLTGLKKEKQQYMRAEVEMEEIKKRKENAEEKIIESKGDLKKLDERRKEVNILEKDIEKLEFDPSVYEKVKKELDDKSQIEREMIKLDERISKKAEVTQSIAETEEKLLNQQKEIKTVRANLEEVKDVPEKFTEVKNKKDKINEEEIKISREYTEKKTQYSERAKEIQKLQTLKGTLKDIKKTQEEIKSAILTYAVLQDAFKQIPVQIQSRLRPRIRKETSGLLNEVTEGKYPFIDLEKDYSLTVYYDGNYYPISRFSGGEKDLINVCLRVGISRVLVSLSAQKSFARVQSLFLDECFGSFDMERRRNLLAALNQLRKYFAQIVLITHIEEIKEALPEAFLVEELEDGSSIIKKVK